MKVKFVQNLAQAAGRVAGTVGRNLKQASPEILLVAGVAGVVAATVMACRATRAANDILDEHNEARKDLQEEEELVAVDENGDVVDNVNPDESTDIQAVAIVDKRALWKLYAKTGAKMVRLYGPSVALGVASIAMIFASHGIMKKRNAGLLAAYSVLENGFYEYRNRVRALIGDEEEEKLRFGTTVQEISEHFVDENGEETTVVKTAPVFDLNHCSPYARYFDAYSIGNWQGDLAEEMFLDGQEDYLNHLLHAKENQVIVLNEAYRCLGLAESVAGSYAGWALGVGGDDEVRFHRIKGYRQIEENGQMIFIPTTILDFNCLPDVHRYMDRAEELMRKQMVIE